MMMKSLIAFIALAFVASMAGAATNNYNIGDNTSANITGGTISGLSTPLPVASGGSGAATAQGAAANLGAAYRLDSSAVQVTLPANTSEAILFTCNVPAGGMGANGIVRMDWYATRTNNANAMDFRVRVGGLTGTVVFLEETTGHVGIGWYGLVQNRNATNSQVGVTITRALTAGAGINTGLQVWSATSATDSTAAFTIVVTGQKGTAGDTLTLEHGSCSLEQRT